MASTVYRAGVFALYQFSIVLGLALFPVALLARQAGVSVPLGRIVDRLGAAYMSAERGEERAPEP